MLLSIVNMKKSCSEYSKKSSSQKLFTLKNLFPLVPTATLHDLFNTLLGYKPSFSCLYQSLTAVHVKQCYERYRVARKTSVFIF